MEPRDSSKSEKPQSRTSTSNPPGEVRFEKLLRKSLWCLFRSHDKARSQRRQFPAQFLVETPARIRWDRVPVCGPAPNLLATDGNQARHPRTETGKTSWAGNCGPIAPATSRPVLQNLFRA